MGYKNKPSNFNKGGAHSIPRIRQKAMGKNKKIGEGK